MRRRYFSLTAFLVAALLVVSLGVTPVLADDGPKPTNIQYQGAKARHRTSFEITFVGFSRFFRMAYQRLSVVLPVVTPPTFGPAPGDSDEPVFMMMSRPAKDDPNEVPGPSIIDGANPIG